MFVILSVSEGSQILRFAQNDKYAMGTAMNFDWLSASTVGAHPLILLSIVVALWLYKKFTRRASLAWPRIPTGFISFALILYIAAPQIERLNATNLDLFVDVVATLALYLGVARASVYLLIDYFLERRRHVKVPTITSDLLLAILWFIIIMVILRQKLNFDLASLITTSAILTAVLGFALQDTLGNLFAGLAIQAERPYQIGDWVQLGQFVGQVEGISWKSTKVVTTTRETVYVPNGIISKGAIFNYSQPTPEYIAVMDVGVSYDAPPNRLRRILMEVLTRHPQIMQQRKQEVRVKSFGDHAVIYQLRFWVNNYALENKIKSDIYSHIWYRLRREKIHIPYPTREIVQTQAVDQVTPSNIIEELLESVELFHPLGETARKTLAQRARIQLYGAHEEVVQQGAPGNSLYIILHGRCRVFVWTDKDTSPRPVAVLNPGDFFGEMSLLTGAPRRATVVAEEETECVLIDKADVKDLLLAKPEVAQEISRVLADRQTALKSVMDTQESTAAETNASQILNKIWEFFKT